MAPLTTLEQELAEEEKVLVIHTLPHKTFVISLHYVYHPPMACIAPLTTRHLTFHFARHEQSFN